MESLVAHRRDPGGRTARRARYACGPARLPQATTVNLTVGVLRILRGEVSTRGVLPPEACFEPMPFFEMAQYGKEEDRDEPCSAKRWRALLTEATHVRAQARLKPGLVETRDPNPLPSVATLWLPPGEFGWRWQPLYFVRMATLSFPAGLEIWMRHCLYSASS